MIAKAIIDLLSSQSAITALVPAERIHTALPSKSPLPAIDVRQSGSGSMWQSLQGSVAVFTNFITIDCYGAGDHSDSDAIAKLLYSEAILGFRGTRKGVFISGITAIESPVHDTETVEPGTEDRRFVTTVDWIVNWSIAS